MTFSTSPVGAADDDRRILTGTYPYSHIRDNSQDKVFSLQLCNEKFVRSIHFRIQDYFEHN